MLSQGDIVAIRCPGVQRRFLKSLKTQVLKPAFSMFYLTISTYMPLGKSGRAPVDVRLPTGWPRTLKIVLPGLPSFRF